MNCLNILKLKLFINIVKYWNKKEINIVYILVVVYLCILLGRKYLFLIIYLCFKIVNKKLFLIFGVWRFLWMLNKFFILVNFLIDSVFFDLFVGFRVRLSLYLFFKFFGKFLVILVNDFRVFCILINI